MISSDEDDESDDEEKAREEMQGFIAVSNYFLSFYKSKLFWTYPKNFGPDPKTAWYYSHCLGMSYYAKVFWGLK